MPTALKCPICAEVFGIPEDGAGSPVRCPNCDHPVDWQSAQGLVVGSSDSPRSWVQVRAGLGFIVACQMINLFSFFLLAILQIVFADLVPNLPTKPGSAPPLFYWILVVISFISFGLLRRAGLKGLSDVPSESGVSTSASFALLTWNLFLRMWVGAGVLYFAIVLTIYLRCALLALIGIVLAVLLGLALIIGLASGVASFFLYLVTLRGIASYWKNRGLATLVVIYMIVFPTITLTLAIAVGLTVYSMASGGHPAGGQSSFFILHEVNLQAAWFLPCGKSACW